jgi:hypothetical protein
VKLLPKSCCSCPPCAKQENTYSIFAGLSQDASSEILRIDEVSDDWNRCCCAPYHPTRLEVRQYVPTPGDASSSGTDHIQNELFRDWDRFSPVDRQRAIHDHYSKFPVLMSILRDDGQRCCKFPCKCLSSWVCFPCCQDGVHLYAGSIAETGGDEKGRYNITPDTGADSLIGRVVQPNFGGCCVPVLQLHSGLDANTNEPFGKVEGPCCFGGWSELCCGYKFIVSEPSSQHDGNLGVITKKKPSDAGSFIAEFCSDADLYSIQFKEEKGLNAEQKLTILAAQLLLDYMLFDGNTKKCEHGDFFVTCYCFYCSILGNVCPCYIAYPNPGNDCCCC